MLISEYDYKLPKKLIAQKPAEPRESARLMAIDRIKDTLEHRHVKDLPDYFSEGDVLVRNNTKVFRARLHGKITDPSGKSRKAEILLVKPTGEKAMHPEWEAMVKPGKYFTKGSTFSVAEGFEAKITSSLPGGTALLGFDHPKDVVIDLADKYGEVPLPPYIAADKENVKGYQTSYAERVGSVAAPTAGFHLTDALLKKLEKKGVRILDVTLHVGLGTFMPIREKEIEMHEMHSEWVDIPDETALEILRAKTEGRRVISVGTTTLRALEGAVERCGGEICPWHGEVDLFIKPGFTFQVVDTLLTNFHLPKSTLLILVSAFAGRKKIIKAYEEAVKEQYRFFSFGDAMLIQ